MANENENKIKCESGQCIFHVGSARNVTYIKDTVGVASDTGSQGAGSVFKERFKHLELSNTSNTIENKTAQNSKKTKKNKKKVV